MIAGGADRSGDRHRRRGQCDQRPASVGGSVRSIRPGCLGGHGAAGTGAVDEDALGRITAARRFVEADCRQAARGAGLQTRVLVLPALTGSPRVPRSFAAHPMPDLGARQVFIKTYCRWQNGSVSTGPCKPSGLIANSSPATPNESMHFHTGSRWIQYYNTRRHHSSIGGQPHISTTSPT